MSQRCLISYRKNVTEEDAFYDCIYDENGTLECLLVDWLDFRKGEGYFVGPWKLNIRDKELFPKFKKDFDLIHVHGPYLRSLDQLWGLYIDGVNVLDENVGVWINEKET